MLCPDDSDVDLQTNQGKKSVARYLRSSAPKGPCEFMVVSRTRWDKHQRRLNAQREKLRSVQPAWQQNSSSSTSGRQVAKGSLEEHRVAWSSSERFRSWLQSKDYLERCADLKVDLDALERLMEPEDEEVCQRKVHPEVLDDSNMFQLFDTKEKKRTISWQAEGVGWSVKERRWPCKKVGKMSGTTLSIKE